MDKELYDQIATIEKNHWWYGARREIIFSFIDAIFDKAINSRILDIGCGTGYNIKELEEIGYNNIFGIDNSFLALGYGKLHHLDKLICGDCLELPIQSETIDLTLMLDILEHIEQDQSVIDEIFRILKPGGKVIIFVPAYMFLWGLQDIVSHHKRRYTAKEIRKILVKSGLSIKKITYVNTILFPGIWLGRTIIRLRNYKIKTISENDITPSWINSMLKQIFLFEKKLLQFINLPYGVSILCIAQKL